MSFTTVPDKSAGDQFTEQMWDTYIKDNGNNLNGRLGTLEGQNLNSRLTTVEGRPYPTVYTNALTSAPTGMVKGDRWRPSDGSVEWYYNGSAWVVANAVNPTITAPPSTGWTWYNRIDEVVDVSGDSLLFQLGPGSAWQYPVYVRSGISGSTWNVTAFGQFIAKPNADAGAGIALYDTATTKKIILYLYSAGTGWVHAYYVRATGTTFNSTIDSGIAGAGLGLGGFYGLRLRADGTNRFAELTTNGRDWVKMSTVAWNDHMAPDRAGFFLNGDTPSLRQVNYRVLGWSLT